MTSKDDHVEAASGGHPPPPPQQQNLPPQKGTFQVAGNPSATQYPHGGQANPPGYAVEARPVDLPPLPCGIGYGWILFILGFLVGVIPWYIGAIILLCSKIDRREKPGCIACSIAAIVGTILIIIVVVVAVTTNGTDHHHSYYY